MSYYSYSGFSRRRRPKRQLHRLIRDFGPWFWGGIILVIAICVIVPVMYSSYSAEHTRVVSICDKSPVNNNGSNQYRIYTSNGTFKIGDKLFVGGTRFDSADVYGRIEVHKVYRLTYHGWRLGFFSQFPNIDRANLISDAKSSGC